MQSMQGSTWIERVPVDLDGNHRFMDDGATEDTGCGPIVVDMGAYEFPGEPMHPVLIGDIDGDGTIGLWTSSRCLGPGACATPSAASRTWTSPGRWTSTTC